MVDADVGPLDPREEALDLIGVCAIVGLIGLRVVDALQLVQASQVVIAAVLVREDRCLP